MQENRKRYTGFDWVRGLAAFGIVGCHLGLENVSEGAKFFLRYTDPNVGLFALIAGFFMAEQFARNPPLWSQFSRKRMTRLLPCYFLWTFIFLAVSCLFHGLSGKGFALPSGVQRWVGIIFKGGASCHLWFLICLFYAQLLVFPLMRIKKPLFFVLTGFVFTVLASLTLPVEVRWFFIYPLRLLAFLLIGIGLHGYLPVLERLSRSTVIALLLLGMAMIQFYSGGLWVTWALFMAIPLFLCAVRLEPRTGFGEKIAYYFGATSMGVYLMHPIFTIANREVIHYFHLQETLPLVLVDWVVAWGCSIVVILILLKIPKVSRFVS